ncbi:hypothetical protein L209DRAFT_746254 [Thermothelomyces heterothallicus CBS 203.75]
MASRVLSHGARALTRIAGPARTFSTSAARLDAVAAGGAASPLPARKPVGALRGGLFGFFLGSSLAAAGIYYYAIQEYKVSNELLTEDIYPASLPACLDHSSDLRYAFIEIHTLGFDSRTLWDMEKLTGCDGQALQNAVERLSKYLTTLEEKMEALERRKN